MKSRTLIRTVSAAEGYRRWSASYDSDANPMLSVERRFLECLLPPVEGRDVVDLGCGTGRWLEALEGRSAGSLAGLDSSGEMLARAGKKLGGRAILVAGDCESAPMETASADLILCSFVLSYISNIGRFIEQIRRIARPNADIFVTDLHPETEKRLGWRRGFRNGKEQVEVATQKRSLESILSCFEQQGIRPVASLEPRFGEPEFEILENAGKSALIDELRGEPTIYLLHLRPYGQSPISGPTVSKRGDLKGICGGRIAFGPGESTLADMRFEDGRIALIGSEFNLLPSRATEPASETFPEPGTYVADLSGFLVLPGLINAHDHLEFALFPRLGRGGYQNFAEWADDIHRSNASSIREHRAVPKSTRLWWGAIRNLLCGVTTVCHHNPYVSEVFDDSFAIRVLRDFGWAHSITMEGDVASRHAKTPPQQPFILHLGEGVDRASGEELFELDGMGALTDRTVVVHGLGLNAEPLSLLKSRGAALVWCPSSNAFLFGRTLSRGSLRKLPLVALGSDSSLTAEGDLLDELRFARERAGMTAEELYRQVTLGASRVLRLRSGEGSLRVGAAADLIAIKDRNLRPAEALANSTYRDIELVIIGGRVQLASARLKGRLSAELCEGLEPLAVDGEVRWIRAPLGQLFEDTRLALGREFTMNGRKLSGSVVAPCQNHPRATAPAPSVSAEQLESHRMTQLPVLVLHVHSSCNCRCVMCDIWKTSEVRALEPSDLEPHLASIRRLGVRWIVFSGGEPLLNRGFPQLCAMLKREGIRLTLLTTGLLLRKNAREVVDSFDDVIVSLDGPKEVHDSIRQVRGGYDLIDAGVKAIRDIRPDYPITARTTVQKGNFRCLRETIRAAKSLGLDGVSFLPVDLTSQAFNRPLVWPIARQNEIGLCVSDLKELEGEIEALIRENAEEIRNGFIAESPEKLRRIVKHFRAHLGLEEAESPLCNAPWTSAVVEIDGTARPCFFHPPIGNIRDESLQDAINSQRALEFRATLDIGTNPTCKRCVCSLNYPI